MSLATASLLEKVTFGPDGLAPVVVQDAESDTVLMLAWTNAETLRQTIETGLMTYWSRSRQEVWVKGATSGHLQHVESAHLDCDGDALLFRVRQDGGVACHTGRPSCFFRTATPDGWEPGREVGR